MHCCWGTHEGDSVRVHNFTCTCTTLTQCHGTLISLQLSLLVSTSLIFLCRSVALENELLMHKSSTRFFAKHTHLAIVFAGSAERGTLLLWNGGWSIPLAALGEELRLPKVEENALFLRYPRRRFGTRAQLHLLSSTSIRTTLTQCHGTLITPQLPLLVSTSLIFFMSLSSSREWAFI